MLHEISAIPGTSMDYWYSNESDIRISSSAVCHVDSTPDAVTGAVQKHRHFEETIEAFKDSQPTP